MLEILQISHRLENTMDNSATWRITKYFARVVRAIQNSPSLGCSSSTPVFVLWIGVLPVRTLKQMNKHKKGYTAEKKRKKCS